MNRQAEEGPTRDKQVPPVKPKRDREIPWLSLSAFLLSLVIALINAYYALRGPELVVRPPDQILIYRDGEGDASIAAVSVGLQIINTASSEYGDVLTDAELWLQNGKVRFPMSGEVKAVFTAEKPDCEVGARCLRLPNLFLSEESNNLFDVPGGTARAIDLSFALSPANCRGSEADCRRFADFNASVGALEGVKGDSVIELKFNGDGSRRLRCRPQQINGDYVRRNGWQSLGCTAASVHSDKW